MENRLTEQDAPALGRIIGGRFTVDGVLGVGGMGYVYSAHDADGVRVALKVLHPELLANKVAVTRFMTEAETIFKLRHPNIVEVYDYGRDNEDTLFIAMEVLAGQTVVDAIQQRGALPVDESQFIATETARALAAAHSAGVVHRDLKPENVMLVPTPDGKYQVKVLDFGLAVVMENNRIQMQRQRLTQHDVVMGTPGYMSPEQIHGFDVDGRADLYSLGVIWWEMLTGRQLFSGRSSVEVMMRHIEERPPHPERVNASAQLTVPAAQLLASLLEKKKDDRPNDGATVLQYLERLANVSEPARSVTPTSVDMSTLSLSAEPAPPPVDLSPTGIELDQSGPAHAASADLNAMAATLRQSARAASPPTPSRGIEQSGVTPRAEASAPAEPDDLWSWESAAGIEHDIPRAQLKAMARTGKIKLGDKVARKGKPFAEASAFTFLGLVAPTTTPATGEFKGPRGARSTSYRPLVVGAIFLGLGGAAGYVVTQQPQWIDRVKTEIGERLDLSTAPKGWTPSIQAKLDDAAKKSTAPQAYAEKTEAEVLRDIEPMWRVGRARDRAQIDAALIPVVQAFPADPRSVAWFVQNRSEMRGGLRQLSDIGGLQLLDAMEARVGPSDVLTEARAAEALLHGRESDVLTMLEQSSTGESRRLMALAELAQDRPDAAVALLDEAARRDPLNARVYVPRARAALALGLSALTKDAAMARLKIDARDAEARYLMAQYWVNADEPERALQQLRRIKPGRATADETRLDAAWLALHDLKSDDTAQALLKEVQLNDDAPSPTQVEAAAVRAMLGGDRSARGRLQALKAAAPSQPLPHLMDAELALKSGNTRHAAIAAQHAISGGGDVRFPAASYTLLGEALRGEQRQEPATDAFRWAASVDGEATAPLLGLLLMRGLDEPTRETLLDRDPLLESERAPARTVPRLGSAERLSAQPRSITVPASREFFIALAAMGRRDFSGAGSRLYRTMGKHRGDPLLRIYYAAALIGKGQHARALTVLEAVPLGARQRVAMVMLRARALVATDHPDARTAIAEAESAVKKSSMRNERKASVRARLEAMRATLAERSGVSEAAAVRFRAAYRADPRLLSARRALFRR